MKKIIFIIMLLCFIPSSLCGAYISPDALAVRAARHQIEIPEWEGLSEETTQKIMYLVDAVSETDNGDGLHNEDATLARFVYLSSRIHVLMKQHSVAKSDEVTLQLDEAFEEIAVIGAELFTKNERTEIDRYDWSGATAEDYQYQWQAPDGTRIEVVWPSQEIVLTLAALGNDPEKVLRELGSILGPRGISQGRFDPVLSEVGSKGKAIFWQRLSRIYKKDPICIQLLLGGEIVLSRFYKKRNGSNYIAWFKYTVPRRAYFVPTKMEDIVIPHELGHLRFDSLPLKMQQAFANFINEKLAPYPWFRVHPRISENPELTAAETSGLAYNPEDIERSKGVRELFALFYADWILSKDFAKPLLLASEGQYSYRTKRFNDEKLRQKLLAREGTKVRNWFDENIGSQNGSVDPTRTEVLRAA